MTVTRKLTLILVGVMLAAWAIVLSQLHISITENFQAFDTHTRDSIRASVDKAVGDRAMGMHAEARIWMAMSDMHVASNPSDADNANFNEANSLDSTPTEFPAWILRESDVVSLVDLNGNVLWSYAKNGAAWTHDIIRQSNGTVIPQLTQTETGAGQYFFLQSEAGPQLAFSTLITAAADDLPSTHLVVAKTLNSFFYQQISPTNQSLELLYAGDSGDLPDTLSPLLSKAGATNEELFAIEQATSRAYIRYDDPFGNPVLLLAADSPRFLTTLPNNPGVILFLVVSAITMAYLFLMTGVIKYLIGQPLRRLSKQLRDSSLDGLQAVSGRGKNEFETIENMFVEFAAEREKRESSLRTFASAVEATDDAIAIIDWEGTFHYINPGYEKLTGRTLETLNAEKPWWSMVIDNYTMRTRGSDDEWEGEVKIKRPDGEIRSVEVKTYKLDAVESKKANFVFAMQDITEKNAQIAEIQRLATAVKSIEDCIIIADTLGRIQYANPAYEKRCGKKLSEIRGLETNKLSHAASPSSVYDDIRETVVAGKVWRGELKAVFQDGRKVTDEAVISPVINDQGENVNYVTTLHDVTTRVSMEEDLRLAKNKVQQAYDELEERVSQRTNELRTAKNSAEQANFAKSAFLATVSHEIRTPLNGILGMLELLADYPFDSEQKRLLGSADTSANLLLALINDILDFSKIEAGELALDETSVSLRDATEAVVLSLAASAHQKNLTLQSSLDPSLPRNIKVDGVRLQQVLLNLTGNAIKFTSSDKHQGIVSLDVSRGPDTPHGPTLNLCVRDNGIGIPAEAIDTLFKPFTQAESSTTRRFGGTGLGLSISSRLAVLMGGEIAVESVLGAGSAFTVTLPLIETTESATKISPRFASAKQSSPAWRWDEDRARAHILVAEDNPINQDVIRMQLKAIGFSCDLAADGNAALDLWRTNSYDLVLTDCHMPNMDGFELAKAIRSDESASRHVPIVALTANVLSEERDRCRRAGMDECLTKPIERRQLDKALTTHLTIKAVSDSPRDDDLTPAFINKAKSIRKGKQGKTNAGSGVISKEPNSAGNGLLDMTVFANNIGNDRNVQCDLLRRFSEEAENNLVENRAALTEEDAATLKCNAHKLKSAARTIGAERLAQVCVEIESAADADDYLILAELIEQNAMLIALLRKQIKDEIDSTEAMQASTLET